MNKVPTRKASMPKITEPSYDLLSLVTEDNRHEEVWTGRAVGNEFPNGDEPGER